MLHAVARELRLLRRLLPVPNPDLSGAAVSRWRAHDGPVCRRCGAFDGSHRPEPVAATCGQCVAAPPPFDAARSLFPYAGEVRAAIVSSKYGGRPFPSRETARRMREALAGPWKDLIPDDAQPTVVPIPARPWKYFRRGFNLPSLVGAHLAREAGYRFDPLVLVRAREKAPQAALPLPARAGNVAGAFRLPGDVSPPSRVLLLDDVYTTGATVRAAACALKTAGADHIVVVTVARTVP